MPYAIQYHSEAVQTAILALPPKLQARYVALAQRMQQYGAHLGEPHSKAFGGGLFELRLKAPEGIARVFYCTLPEQQIVMLHCFVKKSAKTPAADLLLATTRLNEIKDAYARRTDPKNAPKSRRSR